MSQQNPDIKDVFNDIEYVKNKVNELALTKQDKVKPIVILTLLIFLFSQTLGGAWWAAKISTDVSNMSNIVTEIRGSTSKKETTDLQLQVLRMQIEQNQINLGQLRSMVRENEKNISEINSFRPSERK